MSQRWIETYPALEAIEGLTHGFICRHPEIDVKTDRDTAIARLQPHFNSCLETLGVARAQFSTGEQIHADRIEICGSDGPEGTHFPETDGLVTNCPGQFLGIYVADCGAVYLVDPVKKACGLVHSGKKGSELGIAVKAMQLMEKTFGSRREDIIVQVAPCIRPPDYEIDFAAQIQSDCLNAGVATSHFHDCGVSTSKDLERYYSYRIEKGETGRHLAVLGFPN
ncbi:MAG: laccase domain-containing protein [Verrucomicrobiales bacterium]|nr:laccase domain-containing protein [Verrucomicrobiales bacterium]